MGRIGLTDPEKIRELCSELKPIAISIWKGYLPFCCS